MSRWYEASFGREYLKLYAHRDAAEARADVEAIVQLLSLRRDEPLLDLCCGAGRHLLVLREMGFRQLVGVDLSKELLQAAAEHLADRDERAHTPVQLIRADMRAIPYRNHFAAVVSLFTSFGYFEEDAENQAVFAAVHSSLRPGGAFLVDYLNREQVLANLVERDEEILPDRRVRRVRCLTDDCRRVGKITTVVTKAGARRQFHESVRLYSEPGMVDMLTAVGFAHTRSYGSLDGEGFGPESERLIVVAQKKGEK